MNMENKEQDKFDSDSMYDIVKVGCDLCGCLGKSTVKITKCRCICHGVFEVETDVDGSFKVDYNKRTVEEIKKDSSEK